MNFSSSHAGSNALSTSIERWSRIALALGWVPQWIEGAIFPREMVYFLARCESAGVKRIIESGRQDGYSTQILGEFAERTGCAIVSLDYEDDPERAEAARQRLKKFRVDCIKGDAFMETDRIIDQAPDVSTALLYDGPKGFPALALTFAAARRSNVRIIAQHNLVRGTAERDLVELLNTGPVGYEDDVAVEGEGWKGLTHAEINWATRSHAARSVEQSTLCVMDISKANRARVSNSVHPGFRFFQPAIVSTLWGARMYQTAGSIFVLQTRVSAWVQKLRAGMRTLRS